MTDTALNQAIAEAMGYTYAGPFRGRDMYHPPGQRTTVVPLPDYVHDWNLLIPVVLCHGLLETMIGGLRNADDGGACVRRPLCAVLADRARVEGTP